jgi:hypothetical protein
MAQVDESPTLNYVAAPDDADPVTQGLHFGEDVARQQDRSTIPSILLDAQPKFGFHERIETGSGLVENQQFDVGRQCRDQGDLLSIPLGIRATLLGRVQIETLEELILLGEVEPASQPT